MRKNYFFVLGLMFIALGAFAQLPIPVMNPINGQAIVCSGPAATYVYSTSASNSPTSYQWSIASPSAGIIISNPSSGTTSITFPNTNLNYTIYCTASNASGVSAPTSIIIKVFETPSVTFSGAQQFCQGSSTNLSASPTLISASSTLTYSWSPSTGLNTTTGPTVMANPGATTTYTVLLNLAPCSNTAYVTVTVNPLPSVVANITKAVFCKLETQTLTLSGSAVTYSINSILTPTFNTLTYTASGGILITIIGEDANGCKASGSISFSVANCTVDLDEFIQKTQDDFIVYPNPNAGAFFIKGLDADKPVFIFNELGMLIRSVDFDKAKEIAISGLSPGIYLISNGFYKYKVIVYD